MFVYYSWWIKDFLQKIHSLVHNSDFPLPDHVKSSFEQLKNDVKNSAVTAIDPSQTLIVETDASDNAIGATLTQNSRPVAFFSRSLKSNELKLHSVEKEAYAIAKALQEWKHFLIGTHFKLMTDQKSVVFMFNSNSKGKIKNDKIARWRVKFSNFKFDIVYRPGKENHSANTFSRINSHYAIPE